VRVPLLGSVTLPALVATDRVHGGRVVNAAADSQPGIYYVVLQLSRVSGIPLLSLNVVPGAGVSVAPQASTARTGLGYLTA